MASPRISPPRLYLVALDGWPPDCSNVLLVALGRIHASLRVGHLR
jgi:hypothetical protein